MVYVFLADGFEEIEALAPVDIMRRAGIEVQTVGVTGKTVTGGHEISVLADINLTDVNMDNIEAIMLPGGLEGTLNLEKNEKVQSIIDYCADNNILITAICAAPSILAHKGILKGKTATAYPSFQKDLTEGGAEVPKDFVCRDGNVVTARGMGVSLDFGFEIIKVLKGDMAEKNIREQIQCRP